MAPMLTRGTSSTSRASTRRRGRVVQGNCQKAPDSEALQLTSLPRRPLSPRQCIIAWSTEQTLSVSTNRNGTWIDNIYFIESGTGSTTQYKPVVEVSNTEAARVFLTRLTLQGHGALRASSAHGSGSHRRRGAHPVAGCAPVHACMTLLTRR